MNRRKNGNDNGPTFWTPAQDAPTGAPASPRPAPLPDRPQKRPRFCRDFAMTMLFMVTMVIDLAAARCMLFL
jgi:hypothetical protein